MVNEESVVDEKAEFLDHVRQLMLERESGKQVSNIDMYAEEAERPFRTQSMKDVAGSGTFTGPPKYLA